MEEIQKDIIGYEGVYAVTTNGRVWCYPRKVRFSNRKGKWIKPRIVKGYSLVSLVVNKQCKQVKVHRLVAEAFIPNPENKPEVNHINGTKDDNRVINLEWNTHSENQKHSYQFLLRKPSNGYLKNKWIQDNL